MWVPIDQLKPWERNPRLNDHAVDRVAESIKRFGFGAPILARRADGEVIAGHTRLKAAEKLGLERVPVRYLDLDPADAHLLALADNRLSEIAEWDDEALGEILRDIRADDLDLGATGFSDDELAALLAGPPAGTGGEDPGPAPPPAVAVSRRGETYQLGPHRLRCGDATDPADVAALMDGERARLLATDPPYGVNYAAVKDGIPRSGFRSQQADWGDIENDGLDGPALQTFLETCFRAVLPYLDRAAWYLWHAQMTQGFFAAAAAAAAAANLVLHRQIVWRKQHFVLTRSGMYHWQHELCYALEIEPAFVDVARVRWTKFARSAGIDPGPDALDIPSATEGAA